MFLFASCQVDSLTKPLEEPTEMHIRTIGLEGSLTDALERQVCYSRFLIAIIGSSVDFVNR